MHFVVEKGRQMFFFLKMLPRDFFLIGRRRDKVYTIWHKNVDGEGENEKSENQNM